MLKGIDVSTLQGNIGYFLTSWITKYYKTKEKNYGKHK